MEQPPPLSEHYSTEASGRAANRAIYGQGRLMGRDRPSREAADEASVDVSLNLGLGIARVAATARCSRGLRPRTYQNQAEWRRHHGIDPHHAATNTARSEVRRYAKEEIVTHSEIDDVKWRFAELLGESFGLYSEDEIAELEAALRTDDPEERQRIYDKWADRPAIEHGDPPLSDCFECRRPMRFGYPPQCAKHPYKEDMAD